MTAYVEALTSAVFEEIKSGDPEQFEDDFRRAYRKAAAKEPTLSRGQISNFWPTVKGKVTNKLIAYRRRAAPINTASQMAFLTKPPAPREVNCSSMPEWFRQWATNFKAGTRPTSR